MNLKTNPITDRRLFKLIEQCRTKQVLDYVKAHSPKVIVNTEPKNKKNSQKSESSEEDDSSYKHTIRVKYAKDNNLKIILNESVKSVREFFVACLVHNVNFNEENFKKFIQVQNKLHENVCGKRNLSTLATHDLNKLVIIIYFFLFSNCFGSPQVT